MREAVIVSAVRIPTGRHGGALASIPAEHLAAMVIKEAVDRAGIDPAEVDDVIFGNLRANEIGGVARVAWLQAGMPIDVPGVTMDRACASSLTGYVFASTMIRAGEGDVFVVGGVEMDSRAPWILTRTTAAYQFMPPAWSEILSSPKDPYGNPNMGITAENVAEKFKITREECDAFALLSHQKAANAWNAGNFDGQCLPVEIPQRKGDSTLFSRDECVRFDATIEALSALRPVFKKDGIVTAGNSSPMNDGAAALVVMEKEKAKAMGLNIMAKFKAHATVGVDPRIMGIGPIEATRKLFAKTGMTLKDIDLIELNEAFAAQSIACIRELDIDMDMLNPNGGAIALGHPLGATGAILVTKMVYEMERCNLGTGLISFCSGGGQGTSVVLEKE